MSKRPERGVWSSCKAEAIAIGIVWVLTLGLGFLEADAKGMSLLWIGGGFFVVLAMGVLVRVGIALGKRLDYMIDLVEPPEAIIRKEDAAMRRAEDDHRRTRDRVLSAQDAALLETENDNAQGAPPDDRPSPRLTPRQRWRRTLDGSGAPPASGHT